MGWLDKLMAAFPGSRRLEQGKSGLDEIVIDIPSEIYIKELAVYSAISLIANAISQSEIKVYVNNRSVRDEDYYSLNVKPNPNESASQFWHKVTEKAFRCEKGALCFIKGRKLYCADDFYLEQKRPFEGNIYSGITIDDFQINRKFRADEVFLFKLENIQAKQLIDGVHKSLGSCIDAAMSAYKDTNATKYILNVAGVQAGDDKFKEEWENILKENLSKYMNNEAKLYVQYSGRELQKMKQEGSQKSSDDIVKLIEETFKITGKAFKIPESLMLGNITNMNDVVKSFLTFAVDPWANTIGQVLTGQYGFDNWACGNYFKVDTSEVNHVDIFDMADKVDKLISSAFASVDEVREKAGLDRLGEEWSSKHLLTKNYEFIEENSIVGGEKIEKQSENDDEI